MTSKTPLYSLHKEFGSQINARYGLAAAQVVLRHANVAVTSPPLLGGAAVFMAVSAARRR